MAGTAERLRGGGIPPLEHNDLIKPGGIPPILEPYNIPLHPSVFEADFISSPEFVQSVVDGLPGSISRDIRAIKARLGMRLDIQVTPEGITDGRKLVPFRRFPIEITEKIIEVDAYGTAEAINTWIRRGEPMIEIPYGSPIPQEKLEAYSVDPEKYNAEGVITWHAYNIAMASLGTMLVLRNFAILVNNLGLAKLADQRRNATVQVDPKDYYPEWGAGDY